MQDLLKALLAAKRAISNPVKDSKNPHFRNNYASLESVLDAVNGPLHDNGLVLVQTVSPLDNDALLTTTLWHESGQSIASSVALNPAKKDPQGYAAAATYYRRLSIKAMLGLAEVDDDGEEASGRGAVARVQAKFGGSRVVPEHDAATLVSMMQEAKTMADLDSLAGKARNLPERDKGIVREAYQSRKEALS